MLYDRRTLLPLLASLVLSTAACGLNSDVTDVFKGDSSSTAGAAGSATAGAAGTGTAGAGGSSAGAAGSAGSTSSNVGGGGSAGTAGQGGTSTMTSVGGGGTTTTSMPTEDCLDGLDNDGDGDADCADSDCKPDYQCVPAVPAGWQGYFQVSRTDYPTPPGSCDGGVVPQVYFAGPAGPPECNACTCGNLQGGSCSLPGISCFPGSGSCNNQATDWTAALADGQCHKPQLPGFTFQLSCELTGTSQVVNKGMCEPSMSDFANKNTWQNEVGACSLPPPGGGCGGGEVCLPKPGPGQTGKLCIQKSGDSACPAASLQQVVAYAGGTDNRSCSACSCGDGNASCGGGGYTFYDADGCGNGGDNPIPVDSQTCKDVSPLLDFGSWSVKATPPQVRGSCPASGGAPQGKVDAQGPVTFCCQP